MTTFAYTRVSTAEQIAGTSLDDQVSRIAALIVGLGLPTPTVITDPGVSGSIPLADRPGGFELMQRAARGDTIVAAKLDRLFRSARDAINVAEELKARGVDLILMDLSTEPVNGDGVGKVLFNMMASFAELERSRIAERMSAGRAAKRAAGGATGQAPYGFRKVGVGKAAMLEPDPEQQAVIHTILRGHRAGMSLRQIKSLLSSMHPEAKVSHVTIGKIIARSEVQS